MHGTRRNLEHIVFFICETCALEKIFSFFSAVIEVAATTTCSLSAGVLGRLPYTRVGVHLEHVSSS